MIDRALCLLLMLRAKGIARKAGRQLRTKKGILMTVLGLGLFAPMVLPALLMPRMPASLFGVTRQVMPVFLLAYCVLGLVTTSISERAILFNPAEIHFLFPGPFTRRQLLAYKVASSLGACLVTGLLLSFCATQYASGYLAGLFALTLALCFLQLFGMVVSLSASTVGIMAHNRRRKIVLALLSVACLYAALAGGMDLLSKPPIAAWRSVRDSQALRVAALPFRPFAELYTAERLWPDLVVWGTVSLALDVAMIAALFLLNARYLEAADATSERVYKKIERLRRSGGAGMLRTPKRAGSSLPMLPLWHGAGPIAWRQMMTARRDVARLILGLSAIGGMLVPMIFLRRVDGINAGVITGLQATMLGMSFLLSTILTYDFRADYERMAELKSLPVAPLPLVIGQLITPVVVMTVVQWVVSGALLALGGRLSVANVGIAALVLPISLILIAVDNLWFLLFPNRTGMPGSLDFQHMGQTMLMTLVKFALLGVGGGIAAGLGFGVYYVSGGSLIAAFVTSWIILMLTACALVPFITSAFARFDVAADAPGT